MLNEHVLELKSQIPTQNAKIEQKFRFRLHLCRWRASFDLFLYNPLFLLICLTNMSLVYATNAEKSVSKWHRALPQELTTFPPFSRRYLSTWTWKLRFVVILDYRVLTMTIRVYWACNLLLVEHILWYQVLVILVLMDHVMMV